MPRLTTPATTPTVVIVPTYFLAAAPFPFFAFMPENAAMPPVTSPTPAAAMVRVRMGIARATRGVAGTAGAPGTTGAAGAAGAAWAGAGAAAGAAGAAACASQD